MSETCPLPLPPPPPSAADGQCLLEQEDARFVVGLVGVGPGFMSILEIIHNKEYQDFLPELELVAVSDAEHAPARLEWLERLGVPVYPDWQAMLAARPDINLVIELTSSAMKTTELRVGLPPRISLVDHPGAIFFCGLHNMLQTSRYCRSSLDQQKSLLQTIIDEVREDIMVLDREGRLVDCNRQVAQRAGLEKEKLLGLPCWQVERVAMHQCFCDRDDPGCPFHATLRSGEASEAMVTRVDATGELRFYRVYSYPIPNARGEVGNVLMMRRDITERTRRERQQQQQEKLAVVGEMSMYLAHEIRNPLFAIAGFANRLRAADNLEPEQREKLEIIVQESRRLEGMLASILNFSKPVEGEEARADIGKLAVDAVNFLNLGYAHQGYSLVLERDEQLPHVRGEAARITQCLINLVKNAVEAMPGGGAIRLALHRDNGHVRLDVTDHGVGMSEAAIEKAFSPFFTTKASGAGLGLAMIKKTVEDVGGSVSIRSREGEGATVTLRLPAV